MRSRKTTQAEAAVFDRLAQLVAVAIGGPAPPAERTPPAVPGLTAEQYDTLSAFTPAERKRIGAILDRLPPAAPTSAPASTPVPVPCTKFTGSASPGKGSNARSRHYGKRVKRS